jgi:fibronectin type 3 domain-containing protein
MKRNVLFLAGALILCGLAVSTSLARQNQGQNKSPTVKIVHHSAVLKWNAAVPAKGTTVKGYNVYRGTVSGGPYTKINPVLVTALTYTDSTIKAGQTLYWVVTAVGSDGKESAYSKPFSATVPGP